VSTNNDTGADRTRWRVTFTLTHHLWLAAPALLILLSSSPTDYLPCQLWPTRQGAFDRQFV